MGRSALQLSVWNLGAVLATMLQGCERSGGSNESDAHDHDCEDGGCCDTGCYYGDEYGVPQCAGPSDCYVGELCSGGQCEESLSSVAHCEALAYEEIPLPAELQAGAIPLAFVQHDLLVDAGDTAVLLGADGQLHDLGFDLQWTTAVRVADIDADGDGDLVAVHPTGDAIAILHADGAGGFGEGLVVPAGGDIVVLTTADLDDDGSVEVVTAEWTGGNAYAVVVHAGADLQAVAQTLAPDGDGLLATGNWIGAAASDVVAHVAGMTSVWEGTQLSHSWLDDEWSQALASYDASRTLVVGDLDADGYDDVVLGATMGARDGSWRAVRILAGGQYDVVANRSWIVDPVPFQNGTGRTIVAEIDGDGAADVVSVGNHRVHFLFGAQGRPAEPRCATELAPDGLPTESDLLPVAGDLDGDGRDELAISNGTTMMLLRISP